MRPERSNPKEASGGRSERKHFYMAAFSGTPYKIGISNLGLPEVDETTRVLDVGAGASDMVAHFLEKGADAYAVDPIYSDITFLTDSWRQQIPNLVEREIIPPEREKELNEALEHFQDSFRANQGRYVAAYATELPFPDNYFSLSYSSAAVVGNLDIDDITLLGATKELLRVTRVGGTVHLAPVRGNIQEDPPNTDSPDARIMRILQLYSHDTWFRWLNKSKKISYTVETIPEKASRRVIITKLG